MRRGELRSRLTDTYEVDAEQEIVFTVRIRGFGKRDVIQRSSERALSRAVHFAFGADRVVIRASRGARRRSDGV